jgi:hypothetical protein
MKSVLLKVEGSCIDFTALPAPISKIGKTPVMLNGKHFPDCAISKGYHRLKDKPLAIHGVELEDGAVTLDSILAFDIFGETEPTKTVKLRCFGNCEKLLTAICKQLK